MKPSDSETASEGAGSLHRLVRRAERTNDYHGKPRWQVEWWLHRENKWVFAEECQYESEAIASATRMFWNGFTARVVEVVDIVRRTVVAEVPASSPNEKLSDCE